MSWCIKQCASLLSPSLKPLFYQKLMCSHGQGHSMGISEMFNAFLKLLLAWIAFSKIFCAELIIFSCFMTLMDCSVYKLLSLFNTLTWIKATRLWQMTRQEDLQTSLQLNCVRAFTISGYFHYTVLCLSLPKQKQVVCFLLLQALLAVLCRMRERGLQVHSSL